MEKPEKIKKPRSPKKDLLFALILIVIAVVLFVFASSASPDGPAPRQSDPGYQEYQTQRYTAQALNIGGAVVLIGGLYFLVFFIKEKFGKQIFSILRKIGHIIGFALEWLYRLICRILGIDPDRFFARGKDKRSFRRRRNVEEDGINLAKPIGKRYKDMQDNLQRIRFIYRKFLQKIIKKGHKFKYARTPVEERALLIEEEYLEKEDQQFLVNLYVDNRYARPERVHITDDDVEVCRNVK